jgi:hypothetical protein
MRALRLAVPLAAMAVVLSAAAADACGCGAVISPQDSPGQRIDEWSLVRFDGNTEEILMRLRFGVPLDSAALVLPVRPGATVALGDDAEFDRIDRLTRPRIEHRNRYHAGFSPSDDDDDAFDTAGGPATAGGGGPQVTVVGTQDLGPLHVVTLRSRSSTELERWLHENGFPLPSGLADGTQSYLDDDWDLVVAKLRAEAAGTPLSALQPLAIRFPTDEPVYPLKLSRMAAAGSTARLDVFAPYRVGVGTYPGVELLYAGDSEEDDAYLTSLRFAIDATTPNADPDFTRAGDQSGYQRVTVVYDDVYIADTAAPIIAALLAAGRGFWLVRRPQRRRRTA